MKSKSLEFSYFSDKISAVDAKTEAMKIAFAPLTFQAVRALLELGLLQKISDAGENGITVQELSDSSSISEYGVGVLCEIALGMGIIKIAEKPLDSSLGKLVLGKIGFFLLEDECTRVNFYFSSDVCYKGAENLTESIKTGKPEGLRVFGENWTTIYEALSSLPEKEKKSWFDFDHFYSDVAFPEVLPIVYKKKPKSLLDIGGNTAKWAIASCHFDADVRVTIVDLPGQVALAKKNADEAGFSDRIDAVSGNVLDDLTKLPKNMDAVWMSQFLDCFSLSQITKILKKIHESASEHTIVWVLEPLWDKQKYTLESFALQATSLYFTCMANGNSKMYRYKELVCAIEKAGFRICEEHHNLGANFYSLLGFKKISEG